MSGFGEDECVLSRLYDRSDKGHKAREENVVNAWPKMVETVAYVILEVESMD